MGVISSDSIFHFTKSKGLLFGILANEFQPNFCFERCVLKNRVLKGAYPMVCFCDIPLSQVKEHMGEYYGDYGIGMSKSWAERKGLNPVLYVKKTSHLAAHIKALVDISRSTEELKTTMQKTLISILRYVKPFEGNYLRGEKIPDKIKFYDERELRYVPPPELTNNRHLFLSEKQYNDLKTRNKYNSKVKQLKLSFEPDDIRYIIIKNDDEILSMVDELQKIKKKYSYGAVQKLLTRIITTEQIKRDF